jgi:hypothetical protein
VLYLDIIVVSKERRKMTTDLLTALNHWLKKHEIQVEVTPELAKVIARNGDLSHLSFISKSHRFEITGDKRWVAEVDGKVVTFRCYHGIYHTSRPVPIPHVQPDDIFHEWTQI